MPVKNHKMMTNEVFLFGSNAQPREALGQATSGFVTCEQMRNFNDPNLG